MVVVAQSTGMSPLSWSKSKASQGRDFSLRVLVSVVSLLDRGRVGLLLLSSFYHDPQLCSTLFVKNNNKETKTFSPGDAHSRSFQLADSLWTDPGRKSGIGARKVIST